MFRQCLGTLVGDRHKLQEEKQSNTETLDRNILTYIVLVSPRLYLLEPIFTECNNVRVKMNVINVTLRITNVFN